MTKIGVIGGSGLDDPKFLKDAQEIEVETPYGPPSSLLTCGKIDGVDVAILARHGRQHTIPPAQVNYRANIRALQSFGCTHVIATTAVGSLRAEIKRGDFVVLDQFIDFTRARVATFHAAFAPGKPAHTPMADPFSTVVRNALIQSASELGLPCHPRGTVVTIEGPRFSTRAESRMYRIWGADVINMSIAPEAALANEAGLEYAAVAMSTDYDCWKEDEAPVTWEMVFAIFSENVQKMTALLLRTIPKLTDVNP